MNEFNESNTFIGKTNFFSVSQAQAEVKYIIYTSTIVETYISTSLILFIIHYMSHLIINENCSFYCNINTMYFMSVQHLSCGFIISHIYFLWLFSKSYYSFLNVLYDCNFLIFLL